MRTIDLGGEIILGMTPLKGLTWVFTDIWEKKGTTGIEAWLMDMDLNPHLKREDKDLVLAGLTEQEKKIRKEGKFVALHGLVYPTFDEHKHVVEPFEIPAHWRKVIAVDPHLKKPTSVLWVTVAQEQRGNISKGDFVVYRELKRDGIIPDIVASIELASGREKIYVRIADPALNIKDNIQGQNPFDTFAEWGFPLTPANKDYQSGVFAIRELLDQIPSGLHIFNTCPTLIWEFRHFSYTDIDEQGKAYSEKVLKRDDDMLDCLRYVINSGLRPAVSPEARPVYDVDKSTGRIRGVIGGPIQTRR
jgi:hypothetical protein